MISVLRSLPLTQKEKAGNEFMVDELNGCTFSQIYNPNYCLGTRKRSGGKAGGEGGGENIVNKINE